MTVGISSYLANKLLDHATGRASFTMPAGVHAKFHTGDPRRGGHLERVEPDQPAAVTFAAAAARAIAMNNTPELTLTGTETISHVSFWDAASSGQFPVVLGRDGVQAAADQATSSASPPIS